MRMPLTFGEFLQQQFGYVSFPSSYWSVVYDDS